MNPNLICSKIQNLLLKGEKVTLPGTGELFIESLPATFLQDGKTIVPPSKKLSFMQTDTEGKYCEGWQDELSGKIKEALARNGEFEVPGVGIFADNGAGEITFTVNADFNFSPDNFYLESISLEVAVPDDTFTIADEEPAAKEIAVSEKTAENPIIEKPVPAEPVQEMAGHDITARKNARKKWMMWIFVAAITVAVMVLFIILFKEDLKPVLENILYTKEELEILQKWAAQ